MAKSFKFKNNNYLDSSSVSFKQKKLSDILQINTRIVDVTESQNGRYITSKIPFNSSDVLCFIFKAVSAWSEETFPVVFFDGTNNLLTVYGMWHRSDNLYFAYSAVFEKCSNNQFRVSRYAQNEEITSSNWHEADDNNVGAIRPDKIFAILKGQYN